MFSVLQFLLVARYINTLGTDLVSTAAGLIIDRYTWIIYNQDKEDMYLMLKDDGTVVLSPQGKYKITDQLQPSASIRQISYKYIISLENKPICNNGYDLPITACMMSKQKKHGWTFIETRYGTLIENEGLCMTRTVQLYDKDDPMDEFGLKMYPCDASVEQLFVVNITPETNWEQDIV